MPPLVRPSVSPADWNARLAAVNVSKDDLNALVANYLFTEGYRDAAENFSREAGISPAIDLDSIESRMEIRRAVQRGDVVSATELVNELDPEILDTNPTLHFHLLQLHLIELIRDSKIPEALAFAQNELAPRGEEHPQFLKELERTMALLAFEMPNLLAPSPPPPSSAMGKNAPPAMPTSIASLFDPAQRINTATELNEAILTAQCHGKIPKLPSLMRILAWGESMLHDRGDFPKWDFEGMLQPDSAIVLDAEEDGGHL